MCDKKRTPVEEEKKTPIEERHAWPTPDSEHDPELHKHLTAQGRPINRIWSYDGD